MDRARVGFTFTNDTVHNFFNEWSSGLPVLLKNSKKANKAVLLAVKQPYQMPANVESKLRWKMYASAVLKVTVGNFKKTHIC